MTDITAPAKLDHPAQWSASVLAAMAEVAAAEAELQDKRLRVLDPFAGVGRQRLAAVLGDASVYEVVGIELQPEWSRCRPGDMDTLQGDATDLPAEWSATFDAVVTSPCYGSRMADSHDARDACKDCGGVGSFPSPGFPIVGEPLPTVPCSRCKGTGLSWRNTYAHALRRAGGDLVPGSAAGMQWGHAYRRLHEAAISEMLRVTKPGGLLAINMSNHIRGGDEQLVVEWWVNQLLVRSCSIVEVRRVPTPRLGYGANGQARVDGEVVIAMRAPTDRRLF